MWLLNNHHAFDSIRCRLRHKKEKFASFVKFVVKKLNQSQSKKFV